MTSAERHCTTCCQRPGRSGWSSMWCADTRTCEEQRGGAAGQGDSLAGGGGRNAGTIQTPGRRSQLMQRVDAASPCGQRCSQLMQLLLTQSCTRISASLRRAGCECSTECGLQQHKQETGRVERCWEGPSGCANWLEPSPHDDLNGASHYSGTITATATAAAHACGRHAVASARQVWEWQQQAGGLHCGPAHMHAPGGPT